MCYYVHKNRQADIRHRYTIYCEYNPCITLYFILAAAKQGNFKQYDFGNFHV